MWEGGGRRCGRHVSDDHERAGEGKSTLLATSGPFYGFRVALDGPAWSSLSLIHLAD